MAEISYVKFKHVNPEDLLSVVNAQEVRTHLVDHDLFNSASIRAWMNEKIETDAMAGCRIRSIYIDGTLAGCCGIQPDDNGFELAIVLSQQFWGFGLSIYKTLMRWAKALDHNEVRFHLLDSRPEYRALNKISTKVQQTKLLGRWFTTYHLSVDRWLAR